MIYVHDNPQGLNFNAVMYAFMRSWYLPELPNHRFKGDAWIKFPAIRVETPQAITYTPINLKIELSSMMLVNQDARLMRAVKARTDAKLMDFQMRQIESEAFDIPAWEKLNQQAFPYDQMFNAALVNKRYAERNGTSTNAYFSIDSDNTLFKEVRKAVTPKPCNCGKPHYVG